MGKMSDRAAERRLEPMQQQLPAGVLKQVTYHAFEVAIAPQPDGSRVLIFTTPFEQLVFAMNGPAALELGRKLTAPTVEVAASMIPVAEQLV